MTRSPMRRPRTRTEAMNSTLGQPEHNLSPIPIRVAALILAAGKSSRMGQAKTLLPLNGKTLLEHAIAAARTSQAEKVWVVVPQDGPLLQKLPSPTSDLEYVQTEDPAGGLSHSLQTGLAAIPDRFGAAAILLADQPKIGADFINWVIAQAIARNAVATRPLFTGSGEAVPGHPFVLMRRAFVEADHLKGEEGARALFRDNPAALHHLEIAAEPPPDIDTPADYADLLAKSQTP